MDSDAEKRTVEWKVGDDMAQPIPKIKIFCCYAHDDDALLEQLAKHLSSRRRLGQITVKTDRDIPAGADREYELTAHLDTAKIILLLISPDFIASDDCYTIMKQALKKHKAEEACVIPIILRSVEWLPLPIGKLQALPREKPVTNWTNQDEAWHEVVQGIGKIVENLGPKQIPSQQEKGVLCLEQIDQPMPPQTISSQDDFTQLKLDSSDQTEEEVEDVPFSADVVAEVIEDDQSRVVSSVQEEEDQKQRISKDQRTDVEPTFSPAQDDDEAPLVNTQASSNQNSFFYSSLDQFLDQFASSYRQEKEQREHERYIKERKHIIRNIREIWITGLLEWLRPEDNRISLRLQEQLDLGVSQYSNRSNPHARNFNKSQELPVGTSILEMYDQALGSLLILGGLGAGKTVLLLELATALLDRAEDDPTQPIPIIFQLSSQIQRRSSRLSLADCVNTELYNMMDSSYYYSKWEPTQIVPLLDGLDEFTSEGQADWMETINIYHQNRLDKGLVPFVVCCSSEEYLALPTRVNLQKAISILPLTNDQIEQYLQHAKGQVQGLRYALHHDSMLLSLARQPFMLRMLTIAYQGARSEDLPEGTYEELQYQVLEAFVKRMLALRGGWQIGTREQVRQWLIYLARQVHSHQETIFSVEDLQSRWSRDKTTRALYDGLDGLVAKFTDIPTKLRIGRRVRNWLLIGLIIVLCSGLLDLLGWLLTLLGSHLLSSIENWTWLIIVMLHLLALLAFNHPFRQLLYYPQRTLRLPWDLDLFLKEAVKHNVLRKVGRRYIFRHRLLRDYFASLETPSSTKPNSINLESRSTSSH